MRLFILKILFVFVIVSALQLTVIPFISVNNIEPNLLVIFTIYYSFSLKKEHALWFGFLTGFVYDLISGGILGVNAFGLTLAAFIAVMYAPKFNTMEILSYKFLGLVFVIGSVFSFLTNFLNGFSANSFALFFFYAILSGLYTAVIATPLLFLIPEKKLNE